MEPGTQNEIKGALDRFMAAFEEHKKVNDARLKAIETKGFAPADLEEKLKKIGADLDKLEDLNKKITESLAEQKAQAEQLDEVEKKLGRFAVAGGAAAADKGPEHKAFFAFVRKGEKRMPDEETKALISGDDSSGGYLAPVEYVKEIIKGVVLVSPMRGLVRVRTTAHRSIQQPKRTATSSARWVGEIQDRDESTNPAYGLVEIPTHEMTAEHYVSFAELEDAAFDVEAELREEFAEQFAKAEGLAIISGNGVGKPFGILDAGSGVAATNSGNANAITADGIITLFHDVPTEYAKNGGFCLNRTVLGAVRKLKDSQGRYLWEPGVANGLPNTILGSPYTECPDMPNEAANALPITFGDHKRAYTLVDRLAMSVVRDDYTKASKGQVKFVARRRVGGQVVLAGAIRALKCAA